MTAEEKIKMSVEAVKEYLNKFGFGERVVEFDKSSATVADAALAVGTVPGRIAKTMSFMVDGAPVLILLAGDVKVDNHKYKEKFHKKAKMLTSEELPELVGHHQGGVCPFAIKEGVKVYLDESLKRFETVFPAAGSGNSAVELSIPELEEASGFTEWVDIAKPIEQS